MLPHRTSKPPLNPSKSVRIAALSPNVVDVNPNKQDGAYGGKEQKAQARPQGTADQTNGGSTSGRSGGVTHNLRKAIQTQPNGGDAPVATAPLRFTSKPKPVHAQDAFARAACEAAKVEYKGILDCGIENGALILFDCPWHKTTMAVKLLGATPEIIVAHLAECSFGHVREAGAA